MPTYTDNGGNGMTGGKKEILEALKNVPSPAAQEGAVVKKPCSRCGNAPKYPMGPSGCATCHWNWINNDNFEEVKE